MSVQPVHGWGAAGRAWLGAGSGGGGGVPAKSRCPPDKLGLKGRISSLSGLESLLHTSPSDKGGHFIYFSLIILLNYRKRALPVTNKDWVVCYF